MAHAITIKCTNNSAEPILRLWDEASRIEEVPSMRELSYPPHVTLAVFPNGFSEIPAVFDEVLASQSKVRVVFDSIGHFENDFVVLWLRPRHCDALLDLHARLHRHFDPAVCHEHYRIDRWVPHCSLATKVPKSKTVQAIEWSQLKRPRIIVEFDTADLVKFPPVAVEKEHRLL